MILYYTVYTCIGFWGLYLGWLHCLGATPLYDHIPVLVTVLCLGQLASRYHKKY